MRVYRLENSHGVGPYRSENGSACRTVNSDWEYYQASDNCPSPKDDMCVSSLTSAHVFGFTSKKQLFQWFRKKDIAKFEDEGFEISVYDVEKKYVIVGSKQCCFLKSVAVKMKSPPGGRALKIDKESTVTKMSTEKWISIGSVTIDKGEFGPDETISVQFTYEQD